YTNKDLQCLNANGMSKLYPRTNLRPNTNHAWTKQKNKFFDCVFFLLNRCLSYFFYIHTFFLYTCVVYLSFRGTSPPPQPVSIFRPRPFPPSATTTPSVEYNPLPRPALTTITTSQATAPPQPVSSTYQPTGRRNPSHENPHLAGPPPVLQVPYVTPPMSLSDVPQPALGMFQPIPIPPPQPPPLLTVTDGQLSMVYIPSGTSFSTIAPG